MRGASQAKVPMLRYPFHLAPRAWIQTLGELPGEQGYRRSSSLWLIGRVIAWCRAFFGSSHYSSSESVMALQCKVH
jgi:hypothetical protein